MFVVALCQPVIEMPQQQNEAKHQHPSVIIRCRIEIQNSKRRQTTNKFFTHDKFPASFYFVFLLALPSAHSDRPALDVVRYYLQLSQIESLVACRPNGFVFVGKLITVHESPNKRVNSGKAAETKCTNTRLGHEIPTPPFTSRTAEPRELNDNKWN